MNNNDHESVGGMPTGVIGEDFFSVAEACGYQYTVCAETLEDLKEELVKIKNLKGPIFLEVKVKIGSGKNLGRPKESAKENRDNFMKYHFSGRLE